MAWVTPLGDSLDGVWRRLLACETGFVEVPHTVRLKNGLAAPCAWPPDGPADGRMRALGVSTLKRALADAGLTEIGDADVVIGTSLGAFLEGEPESAPLNRYADTIAEEVGAKRPPISVSTACSSGADAILVAAEMIRAGAAERVVCGGVDVLTTSKRLAHSILGTMSATTLRAFDVRHDGTLIGEGAGFMVLESVEAAAARARTPFGHLRGVGAANDAAGMTTPDAAGLGARYAMERSLADAGVAPSEIGVVNAHGSGTPLNDATEALALRDLFGAGASPIVFGTKGNFGHSLGATGAIEAIATVLALRNQNVPPVYGLEQPDPAMKLTVPARVPMSLRARYGMSVTLGFGGFDTSLLFEVPS